MILVSPSNLQSSWVGKELRPALAVEKQHSKSIYLVIPLPLDNTKLGVPAAYLDETPLYIARRILLSCPVRCHMPSTAPHLIGNKSCKLAKRVNHGNLFLAKRGSGPTSGRTPSDGWQK